MANINQAIASEHNKHIILHDSQGYDPGKPEKFDILTKFVVERSRHDRISERLHAIWYGSTEYETDHCNL